LFEIAFSDLRMTNQNNVHGRVGVENGLAFSYQKDVIGNPNGNFYVSAVGLLEDYYTTEDMRKDWNIPRISYRALTVTINGNKVSVPTTTRVSFFDQNNTPGKFRRWDVKDDSHIYESGINVPTTEEGFPFILLENNSSVNRSFSAVNMPVLRYSDVLLMYAEAENEINGPTPAAQVVLDLVRTRAGLGNIGTDNPSAISGKFNFFMELVDERARELCFEGIRKMDLIRWGLLEEKLNESKLYLQQHEDFGTNPKAPGYLRASENFDESKHLSLPYPSQEVSINNKLKQKPGW